MLTPEEEAGVIRELADLGRSRDRWRKPEPHVTAWAPGDLPHGESLDLNEYAVTLLRLKKCRSFRADLAHKLAVIIRAAGGYGSAGLTRAACLLRVSPRTLWTWMKWQNAPGQRMIWERVDRLYEEALELLVAAKVKRRAQRKKKTDATAVV